MKVQDILDIISTNEIVPHWPEMKTFPHHFHLHSEKEALECQEFFALDVLQEIRDLIRREGC